MQNHTTEEEAILMERSQELTTLGAEFLEEPVEVLLPKPAATLPDTACVEDAIHMMQRRRIGAVVITNVDGRIAGILTERDLLMKVLGRVSDYGSRSVTEFMTPNPEVLRAGDDLVFLMSLMHEGGYRHVPIENEKGEPEHVLSMRDILAHLLDQFEREITNIPPAPFRGAHRTHSA